MQGLNSFSEGVDPVTTQTLPAVDHRGPVTGKERALAPDLIRGAMLLLIGLANSANFAFAGQPGVESTPHGLERILNFLKLTLVDARAYPVFAVMFGYGLVQLARRQRIVRRLAGAVRRILLKRNGWLIAFGLVHATLLYFGDFLGAYGDRRDHLHAVPAQPRRQVPPDRARHLGVRGRLGLCRRGPGRARRRQQLRPGARADQRPRTRRWALRRTARAWSTGCTSTRCTPPA